MERKKATDFPQELLNLFDLYVHGDIDRREFLDGAKKFATGGLTATAIWNSLRPNYAWAEQVPKDDSRIKTGYETVPSPQGNGSIRGYLVRSASAGGKSPGVLVVHENRGLNPYIEDVARRLGTEKFIAFAPDGLTSVGGYPGDDEKGGQAFGKDSHGLPLSIDGKVGPMTWAALFGGGAASTVSAARTPLLVEVLRVAAAEIGVREDPLGSNSGPRVDQFLASVGLDAKTGSFPWCAAFLFWCFREAASTLGTANPAVKTAGALDVWNLAGARGIHRVASAEAVDTPGLVQPGMIFVIATGGGHGHVGFVEKIEGVVLTTIEGNTNEGGSREGIGVFRRNGRRIGQINRGFVDYS